VTTIEYSAPTSIEEAVGLLAARDERARPLAGGTDLLRQLQAAPVETDRVVDVTQIPELHVLQYDPIQGLTIGAAVSWCRVSEHPQVNA
jgi:xanthine dehydrogenase FAD-binding subunit